MKKYLMIILALASFGAAAGEVELACEGVTRDSHGEGYTYRNVKLNEETGEMFFGSSSKYKKGRDVKYSDETVIGTFQGGWGIAFAPYKVTLDRYTGVLKKSGLVGWGYAIQCSQMSREKLF